MPKPPDNLRDFKSLIEVVASLRGPDGCPWDKEQTHRSLTPYLLEESAELAEAIERGQATEILEELGDVLLQVVLHAQISKENNRGDIADVIEGICSKMIRRHPHVFANVAVSGVDEVWKNWDRIKKTEKPDQPKGPLDVPKGLPALSRAHKIGKKTAKIRFDWQKWQDVLEKVREEFQELEEALEVSNKERIEDELGDFLFSTAQLARHLGLDSEQTLRKANQKFERRFEKVYRLAESRGKKWEDLTADEMESLWSEVKATES